MVWLTWPSPSLLSEWVQACGRLPSTELALVRDAVRERARRVMLAEGTVDRDGASVRASRRAEGQQAGGLTQAKRPARPVLPSAQTPFPSQGSGICSVKANACDAGDSKGASGAGAGVTEASRTLSEQLARATARTDILELV